MAAASRVLPRRPRAAQRQQRAEDEGDAERLREVVHGRVEQARARSREQRGAHSSERCGERGRSGEREQPDCEQRAGGTGRPAGREEPAEPAEQRVPVAVRRLVDCGVRASARERVDRDRPVELPVVAGARDGCEAVVDAVRDGRELGAAPDARQRGHVPPVRPQRCRGDDTRERERKRSGDGLWWYNAPGDPDIMNRAADLALAGTALVAASPLLALAALAVKLEGGGPVLYRQTRVGRDGADFELLKLRTMIVGAEHQGAGLAVNEGDARITRAGAVLRRLSLDELPQLWNVIRGDMSLIGPRPTLRYQVERYTPRQLRRLEVKPGITGWAQIHGRATLPWEERIELDLWYVEHRSPLLDVRILLRTPLALFGGTYKGATGGWRG